MRYKLVSASLGTYAGHFGGKHSFSKEETVICDFLSESGAQGYLEVMPALGETPDDITIVPFKYEPPK